MYCCAQSTYTGVYKKGGPSTVEPSKDLSALLDRSPADVRGIKKSTLAQQGTSPLAGVDKLVCYGRCLHTPPLASVDVNEGRSPDKSAHMSLPCR